MRARVGVTNLAEVGWALADQSVRGRDYPGNVWAWSAWRRGLSVGRLGLQNGQDLDLGAWSV